MSLTLTVPAGSIRIEYHGDAPAEIPTGQVRITTTGPTLLGPREMRMLVSRLLRQLGARRKK